jgi:hypothetical protein
MCYYAHSCLAGLTEQKLYWLKFLLNAVDVQQEWLINIYINALMIIVIVHVETGAPRPIRPYHRAKEA